MLVTATLICLGFTASAWAVVEFVRPVANDNPFYV